MSGFLKSFRAKRRGIVDVDFAARSLDEVQGANNYPDPVLGKKIAENNSALKNILQYYKMQRMLLQNRLGFKRKRIIGGGILAGLYSGADLSPEEKEVLDYLRASEMPPWWRPAKFEYSPVKSLNTLLSIQDAMLTMGVVPPDPGAILQIGENYLEEFSFRADGLKQCLDVLRGGKAELSYKFRKTCYEKYGYRAD